jgi:hypothetical protein
MPDLEREVYFTADVYQQFKPEAERLFDKAVVLQKPEHPTRPRFDACFQTDLEQALFIDGDTLLLEPIPELFELLDLFDIGLMAAPQNLSPRAVRLGIFEMLPPVPAALPEWNSGVIAAKMSPDFHTMARNWSDLYALCKKSGFDMDQASLRSALAHSRLRIAPLPAIYNFRANMPQVFTGKVKILHAHGNLPKIADSINLQSGMRSYMPNGDDIYGFKPRSAAPVEGPIDTKG